MARVRCITEMGMGVDVHGKDATKAARRAVSDAIRHSSIGFVRMLGKTPNDMFVDVTIGVPDPGAVDTAAVAKELPYGTVTVTAVKGGLEIAAERGDDSIIIANAAVIVSLDHDALARTTMSVSPIRILGDKSSPFRGNGAAELQQEGSMSCQRSPPRTASRFSTRIGARGSRSCSAMAGRFRPMTGTRRCCSSWAKASASSRMTGAAMAARASPGAATTWITMPTTSRR